ncbi:MAG: glycosyltransferase family 2 protein [Myxococcota bacterium]
MTDPVRITLVVPAYNECDNIRPLAEEIDRAFAAVNYRWEALWIDDGSTDGTLDALRALPAPHRFIALNHNSGQSAALFSGFHEAKGEWIGTLDADGQNDPADLPGQLDKALNAQVDMVNGIRVNRRDSWLRRVSSKLANSYRRSRLKDGVTDVGCSTRVVRRAMLTGLPFFHGMHRYLPALVAAQGGTIAEMPVNHRPRNTGVSKYGVQNRLWVGLEDVRGVQWLMARQRDWEIAERGEAKNTSKESTCS